MKASIERISTHHSVHAFSISESHFELKWHYHPEYELTYITKGSGKRMVGDHYDNFEEGDLVLIGSGLPHTWISEPETGQSVSAIVIQFSASLISTFFSIDEFYFIKKMFSDCERGYDDTQWFCSPRK